MNNLLSRFRLRIIPAIACGLLIMASAQFSTAANKYNRQVSFAEDPVFKVLETGETFVKLSFNPEESTEEQRNEFQTFIAIPMEGDIQLSIDGWEITALTQEENIKGELAELPKEEHENVYKALRSLFMSEPLTSILGFHDLRILHLQIRSKGRILNPIVETPTTCDVKQLILTISWPQPSSANPTPEKSRLKDGFDTLRRHLILNGEQAEMMRARPPYENVEPQWTDPRWLKIIGYQNNGALLHGPGTEVQYRENVIRLLTEKQGLYVFTGKELSRDGIDLSLINPTQITLWRRGTRIAHRVFDGGDGRFDQKDTVVFYAEKSENPYGRFTTTWMTWDPEFASDPPQLQQPPDEKPGDIQTITSVPYRHRWDEDRRLAPLRSKGYGWVWQISQGDGWVVTRFDTPQKFLPIEWPGRDESSPLAVGVEVWNRLKKPIQITLRAPGISQQADISQREDEALVLEIPADSVPDPDRVELIYPKGGGGEGDALTPSEKHGRESRLFLNWAEVRYLRKLDLSHGGFRFRLPEGTVEVRIRITGAPADDKVVLWEITNQGIIIDWSDKLEPGPEGTLETVLMPDDESSRFELATLGKIRHTEQSWRDNPSTLLRKENQADVIYIAYYTLIDEMQRLVKQRESQGLHTMLVDIQDIYDEFNAGEPSLDAVKQFLKYTQTQWAWPMPEVVALVGDANWDHRDNMQTWIIDQVPIYAPHDDPERYATDEWLGDLWGTLGEDQLPDVIIGRISLGTPEEVRNYIDKVIPFENEPEFGWWRTRNLFIADDTFETDSQDVLNNSTPVYIEPKFVNQIDKSYQTNPYMIHQLLREEKFSPECTYAIVDAFNAGASILQYFGHGGLHLWSHERIFLGTDRGVSDVLLLDEVQRLPFVINWSCLTGLMNYGSPPFNICLMEELLRRPHRGAIAAWAPTEKGTTEHHKILAHHLMMALDDENSRRVGTTTQIARINFSFTRGLRKLVDQYVLFGDPLVRLPIPAKRIEIQTNPTEIQYDPAVDSTENKSLSIKGHANGMNKGKVLVRIYDEDQKIIAEPKESSLDDQGQFSLDLRLPAIKIQSGLQPRFLVVRAYAYDKDSQIDASGGIEVPLGLPDIAIESFNIVDADSDQAPKVRAVLVNQGAVSASPFEVCLTKDGKPIEKKTIDGLEPGEYVDLEMDMKPGNELDYLFLTLDYQNAVQESDETNNSHSFAVLPELHTLDGVPAYCTQSEFNLNPSDPVIGDRTRVEIPLNAIVGEASSTITAAFSAGEITLSTQTVVFESPGEKRIDFDWIPAATGEIELAVHLTNENAASNRTQSMEVSVNDRPDLYFVDNNIQTIPMFPTIGNSCYLNFKIGNRGNVGIDNIRITASFKFEGENRQHQIKSYRNKSYILPPTVEYMAAGEIRDVTIKWDDKGLPPVGNRIVTVTLDETNGIKEADESNNKLTKTIFFQGLPDLVVDLWNDHGFVDPPQSIMNWGDEIKLWGRVSNKGGGPGERVRLSFLVNENEYPRFFDSIASNRKEETQVAIPVVEGHNSFSIEVDRYDLISEQNERAYRTGQKGNNAAKPISFDLTLIMPEGKQENGAIVYYATSPEDFLAGIGPLVTPRPSNGITLKPKALYSITEGLQPEHVTNPDAWGQDRRLQRWYHDTLFSCFRIPENAGELPDLPFRAYVPNGTYQFNLIAFCYTENASAEIKLPGMDTFQLFTIPETSNKKQFIPIGPITTKNGVFEFTVRQGSGGGDLGIYGFMLESLDHDVPHSITHLSPLYPLPADKPQNVKVQWLGRTLEGAHIRMRGRFWTGTGKDAVPGEWTQPQTGESGELILKGTGNYIQWQADLILDEPQARPPILNKVTIYAES